MCVPQQSQRRLRERLCVGVHLQPWWDWGGEGKDLRWWRRGFRNRFMEWHCFYIDGPQPNLGYFYLLLNDIQTHRNLLSIDSIPKCLETSRVGAAEVRLGKNWIQVSHLGGRELMTADSTFCLSRCWEYSQEVGLRRGSGDETWVQALCSKLQVHQVSSELRCPMPAPQLRLFHVSLRLSQNWFGKVAWFNSSQSCTLKVVVGLTNYRFPEDILYLSDKQKVLWLLQVYEKHI